MAGLSLEAWPKSPKSAEDCAHSYTVCEPKTCQEWLFGCVSRRAPTEPLSDGHGFLPNI